MLHPRCNDARRDDRRVNVNQAQLKEQRLVVVLARVDVRRICLGSNTTNGYTNHGERLSQGTSESVNDVGQNIHRERTTR